MVSTETIKIRGLARLTSALLGGWGGLVACKGLYDLFVGQPEANLYAPRPWAFVTREQWLRWAGFELCYGLALLGLAWYCLAWGRRLPETVKRPKKAPEFSLFD
jgi:hypothetical protein